MWQFNTHFEWLPGQGEEGVAGAEGGKPALHITPPADLGGKAGFWTPEDLLVSAVESCMLMTTLSVVQKQRITLKGYRSKAQGRMEKTPEGLRITAIEIQVHAQVATAEEVEKFKRAVAIAERYCPVSAAVKCPVHVVAEATMA